jgi:hypothetical protein
MYGHPVLLSPRMAGSLGLSLFGFEIFLLPQTPECWGFRSGFSEECAEGTTVLWDFHRLRSLGLLGSMSDLSDLEFSGLEKRWPFIPPFPSALSTSIHTHHRVTLSGDILYGSQFLIQRLMGAGGKLPLLCSISQGQREMEVLVTAIAVAYCHCRSSRAGCP